MNRLRIVSLIASATEIVYALGVEEYLVGRSHECDYPPSVAKVPACSSSKIDMDERSYAIDEKVKAIVQEFLSVFKIDAKLLDALQPTHIITQMQCEVCAVSVKDVEDAVCRITGSNPEIIALEPNSLEDVWNDILWIGSAMGCADRAADVAAELHERMDAIVSRVSRGPQRPKQPGLACIEWIDPLMTAGNWMPELIEKAGGESLFGQAGKHSPWMTWEDLHAKDPDHILIMPCGFSIGRTMEEMPLLTGREGWTDLRAVQTGNVYIGDGNQYFNRPGPRLVDSLEILAEILYPEIFDQRHYGTGWVRYS